MAPLRYVDNKQYIGGVINSDIGTRHLLLPSARIHSKGIVVGFVCLFVFPCLKSLLISLFVPQTTQLTYNRYFV